MSDTIRNEIKVDKTALSYWYPKLVEAGIPVPKTKIIMMPVSPQRNSPTATVAIIEPACTATWKGSPLSHHTDIPGTNGRRGCV